LVRTLYERAITLRYLHEHPSEFDDFWDYHNVAEYKFMKHVDDTIGKQGIPDEIRAKITEGYEQVKGRFTIPICKECGTDRVNHTWSKVDFVSMASKCKGIGRLKVSGYILPLRHSHATVGALLSRLEESEDDGVSFNPTAQRNEADAALMTAQNVIMDVLQVQEEHFQIAGLREQIQICVSDFVEMYKKPDATSSPYPSNL
jgi:hypothetical protein